MLLYHAFPRKTAGKRGELEALQRGVDILALMMSYGLVLTPETLDMPPDPRAPDLGEPPKTCFDQERACFTLVAREELQTPRLAGRIGGAPASHADLFGEFAIGLDPVRARRLGVVPVMYFYDGEGYANMSRELLFRLRDLRTLAVAVARIEGRGTMPERDVRSEAELAEKGIVLEGEPRVAPLLDALPPAFARSVHELLDTNRVPAWNLVEWLDIALNLFQTADSRTTPGSLAYFQQREWRIVRLFGEHVACHLLAVPTDADGDPFTRVRGEVRARLAEIDPVFFDDRRLARSSLLSGAAGEPFFDFVDEVVCPMPAAPAVQNLLEQANLDEEFDVFDDTGQAVFRRIDCA